MKKILETMTPGPAVCTPDAQLEDVAKLMVDKNCGEIPIVNNLQERKPIGVITDRDITCRTVAKGRNPLGLTVKECMSSPVVTIDLKEPLEEALRTMVFNKIRRIPVVDEKGSCCGMLSQADVAKSVGPERVGELLALISHPTDHASGVSHH